MFKDDPFFGWLKNFGIFCVFVLYVLWEEIPRFVWILLFVFLLCGVTATCAKAHDPSHHEHDKWYSQIKQPDDPDKIRSCCGLADGYFCDDLRMEKGVQVCTITDDRPDEPRDNRPHIPVGTVIPIPNEKLIGSDQAAVYGNPTGHGVIWVKRSNMTDSGWNVFCYMMGQLT